MADKQLDRSPEEMIKTVLGSDEANKQADANSAKKKPPTEEGKGEQPTQASRKACG